MEGQVREFTKWFVLFSHTSLCSLTLAISCRLVSKLNPFPGMKHLDVAGGTGTLALLIYQFLLL